MRIEDELKTSNFHSEIQKAHLNVIFSAGWVRAKITLALKPFGVTFEQFNVLRIVHGQHPEGIRVKDITNRMLDRSSNTTRIIDRLIEKNMLVRQSSERDGRERTIILTPKGLNLINDIDHEWQSRSPHNSSIDHTDASLLNNLLDQLRE
ncbi:MAG: MarR family transcriptional regulator [Bacteroidota bacterium]